MKTSSRTLLSFILIAAVLFLSARAGFCEEKPPLYSNDDIEKYRHPADNKPQEQRRTTTSVKKDENKKAREKQDQDYWCKRATAAKRKIEHAGRDVRERQEDISREQSKDIRTSRKMSTLQGRLKKAKDQLSSAEGDLSDIENEAHRKGIRPGWLRCQFD